LVWPLQVPAPIVVQSDVLLQPHWPAVPPVQVSTLPQLLACKGSQLGGFLHLPLFPQTPLLHCVAALADVQLLPDCIEHEPSDAPLHESVPAVQSLFW
jgi:hypothetical protein